MRAYPGFRYCGAVFAYLPERGEASGYAVVTPRFVCLLGPEATAEIARNVFWLLDGPDAQLQDAVGTLSHVANVDRFAIVEVLDNSTLTISVTTRGDIAVGIDGNTSARASVVDGGLQLTSDARDVRSAWIGLESEPDGELLPLYRGIVRTSGLATEAMVAFAAEQPRVNSAPIEEAPDVEVAEAGEAEAEEEAQAEVEAAARWVLQLPDGSEVEADGTIIIGRDNWAEPAEGDLIRHVAVESPMKQISGDHLELALVGGELVARDLDSTNGTIVITPEQPPRLLHNGDTTALQAGDILDLGESLQILVTSRG